MVERHPTGQVLQRLDERVAIVLMVGEHPSGAGLLVHRLLVVEPHVVAVQHVVAHLLEERAAAE